MFIEKIFGEGVIIKADDFVLKKNERKLNVWLTNWLPLHASQTSLVQ